MAANSNLALILGHLYNNEGRFENHASDGVRIRLFQLLVRCVKTSIRGNVSKQLKLVFNVLNASSTIQFILTHTYATFSITKPVTPINQHEPFKMLQNTINFTEILMEVCITRFRCFTNRHPYNYARTTSHLTLPRRRKWPTPPLHNWSDLIVRWLIDFERPPLVWLSENYRRTELEITNVILRNDSAPAEETGGENGKITLETARKLSVRARYEIAITVYFNTSKTKNWKTKKLQYHLHEWLRIA